MPKSNKSCSAPFYKCKKCGNKYAWADGMFNEDQICGRCQGLCNPELKLEDRILNYSISSMECEINEKALSNV